MTLCNQFHLVALGEQLLPSVLHVNTMRAVAGKEQDIEKPRNPHYQQDIVRVLKHTKWILRSIGIWPIFLESDNRIVPRFLIGFSDLVLIFTLVPFSLYITFEEKNITVKLKSFGLLTFCTLSLLKHWALAACMPRIKHCVESLDHDWRQVEHLEDRKLMLKYGNVGRSLTLLSLGFMYTGGFTYHTILQYATGTHLDEWNRTVKPLVYPVYSGMYNPQASPVYELVYVAHCLCGYVTCAMTAGACGLAATFATHVCGQIDVMILRFGNLVNFNNKIDLNRGLVQIVEHHIRTLRFSAMVEALLQEVCFLEFIGSTFLICLLEYYILMDWGSNTLSFVTYFMLLTSLMFNIFILCYIGDLLVEKTGNVGLLCFMTDWYKLPTETMRGLVLIIAMSSNPAKISAGQLVVLDLSTFGNTRQKRVARHACVLTRSFGRCLPRQSTPCRVVVIMRDRSAERSGNYLENANYRDDLKYTLEMCRWVMKPIGVWSFVYTRTSRSERLVSIVLFVACFSDLMFATIPPCHYLFFVEKNVYSIVKLIGPIGFCVASAVKFLYLALKGSAFRRCIVHVEKDWQTVADQRHRRIMLRQSYVSRQLIVLCAVFLYTGGMSYHTIMPFVSKPKMRGNQTLKPLIYPGYDAFFDSQASPTYEIIFSMHCFSGFIKYSITTAACSLAATFVTHICGQIQIQILRLEDLVEDVEAKDARFHPLSIIIRDHVKILRFSKNVENALREICLTEIVESTFILCILEYYCLVEWQNSDVVAILTYFVLLVSFTFNITIFCYIGELLTEQCSKIGPAAYKIDWYKLPPTKARDLILLSVVSNYPPKLSAGKIFTLSLNMFSSVMQSSVIYLNLLRTVMD
nr:uncharacterized protein LOC116428019 [Nomia melanderi]